MFLQIDHLGMILTRVTVTAGEAAEGAGALLEEDVEGSVALSVIRGVIGLLNEEVAIIPQLLLVELVWMGILHLFQDRTVDHAQMILGVIIMVEEDEVVFEDEAVVVEDVVAGRGVIIVWCTTEIEILVMEEEVATFGRSPIGNEPKVELILGQLDRAIIAIDRVILRHQGRQVSVWDLHRRLWNAKNWIIAM